MKQILDLTFDEIQLICHNGEFFPFNISDVIEYHFVIENKKIIEFKLVLNYNADFLQGFTFQTENRLARRRLIKFNDVEKFIFIKDLTYRKSYEVQWAPDNNYEDSEQISYHEKYKKLIKEKKCATQDF